MPIQQNPNKRRGEERSETLIIPHITREMLEVARAMAEKGASRAEIEAALAAMQTGKAPAAPAAPAPEKQPGAPQQPAPGRSDAARSGGIIPTSRPRYTAAERRAMLEEVQRRQAEREAARQAEAQAEAERQAMLDRTEKDCDALRAAAMARMDDAVDYLLEKVVKR